MRAVACGHGCAPAVLVKINFETDEMDGGVLPAVGDGVTFVIDLNCFGCEQAAIAQFREEGGEASVPWSVLCPRPSRAVFLARI